MIRAWLRKYATAIIAIAVVAVVTVIGVNYVRDLRSELKDQTTKTATLEQKFQAMGNSVVTKNDLEGLSKATATANEAFGKQVADSMSRTNSVLQSYTTALATIQSQVTQLSTKLADFGKTQDPETGALTGYTLEESRTVPLGSVNLYYDPKKRNPQEAFRGTSWLHYQETFKIDQGEWQSNKNGGYKTTLRLSRTVLKPDPSTPGKMVVVGQEEVPIGDANTLITPEGLKQAAAKVPRWTVSLGIGADATKQKSPAAFVDYRITNRIGIFGGSVNRAAVAGVSVKF
jgi:hypothetical protein